MPAELDALFEKNIGQFAVSLGGALKAALAEYEQLRLAGQKGKLSHIYLSFLLSGVLCSQPWLRIDLCDENDRGADVTECCADWDVSCISDKLYRDAGLLAKQDRMKDYELERAWLDGSKEYLQAFEKHLPQIIDHCTTKKAMNCQWNFGQYLGETMVVRGKTEDEIL